ncbi:hypothetical protein X777_15369 [Ooceraea biroi]|uniref:Uncharacterized protein n=1 Tax=Ooceraea biroi TaxID=2015173 RepID=A0A026VVW2_OOCBI|nr:hypothetical protein X777_15369 [Ooceraea biroi]
MKSQARSFRTLRVSVLLSIVTVSRVRPNWNKNVTSVPSIMPCRRSARQSVEGARSIISHGPRISSIARGLSAAAHWNVVIDLHTYNRRAARLDTRMCDAAAAALFLHVQDRGGIIDRTVASQPASGVTVKSMPDTHSPMTFYSYLQVTDPP